MLMRVGINAICLNDRPSGARQRFIGIYGALFRRLPDAEFVIFEPCDCKVAGWFGGQANVSPHSTPIPSTGRFQKLLSGMLYWRNALSRESFDVFEVLSLPLIRPESGSVILTKHDLRGVRADAPTVHRAVHAAVLRRALAQADHVFTVSAAMRAEILAFYPHAHVSVVYNGVDTRPFEMLTEADCRPIAAKYSLPQDFILSVGHFEGRKNYSRLIDAVALLRERGLESCLVIVGNDSGEQASLLRQIAKLNLSKRVKLLTGLTDHEVRCLYILCSLFVFPSAYEGFGIPILECMAARRPMVLSDLAVFREITENRTTYFPFDDTSAMADAIEFGLTSSDYQEEIIRYGIQRVADFTFDRIADRVAKLYATGN